MAQEPALPVRLSRGGALEALGAILPYDRRDHLAALLTDEDIATLTHLAREGMGDNTLRALASDLAYLEGWCLAATGEPLPWPAPEALVLKFVAHHLWDPAERAETPDHGMPEVVATMLRAQGLLKSPGPHAPATVRRRLTSWSVLTRWRGLAGAFAGSTVKSALRLAVRASDRPRQRKSPIAVTGDILLRLLATCASSALADLRDRALLLVAFASGGRRRSEVAALRVEHIRDEPPVPADPDDPLSAPLACVTLRIGRTKTTTRDDDVSVVLIGEPVTALKAWLAAAAIASGPVFPRIDQWGHLHRRALTPQSVNQIVKTRAARAGLDPARISAHGLRSGYLTEAANRGIPLVEAMQQSLHRSVAQAASYYHDTDRKRSRAARLIL